MRTKDRLSASINAELLAAVEAAARGTTLSAWVSDAIRLKLEHDRRLRALAELVASYEEEHGEITDAEILAAKRRARQRGATRSAGTRKAG